MTRRKLSPEEEALWRKVTENTEALRARETFDPDAVAPPPKPSAARPKPDLNKLNQTFPPKPERRKTSFDLMPSLPDRLQAAPVQMDRKAFAKMTRGKLKPEGRIDLHGMTLDRAHGVLATFILSAHKSGKRLVLVITGKGKNRDEGGPIPVRHGVLRHQVPQWLAAPPLSSVVMQVSQAHVSHGGGGAYYVYLRRRR
ncbi:DNA mismatch repair protein MutS [Roseobacter cerasinus]|uniref:DNA mismatch repair protein MutS n=1 Tax=Roseobacter cerasinus TaxID=2602289 RepID=A0A640VT17_9RHOB|nr:Smr/MutS family protein [Roseobacter cerasinus]GFE49366.1 DNA mismatch repair protein MutS [Roseobacter cerasinus]